MTQAYSDPERASDPMALPDIEIWADYAVTVDCPECGDLTLPSGPLNVNCPECGSLPIESYSEDILKWWYWYCFPGCLPDSDVRGPYDTKAEALADAQADT